MQTTITFKFILSSLWQPKTTVFVNICRGLIIVTGLLLLPAQGVRAQPFYVDPCAQGNGNGSLAAPFNTLASAVAAAKAFPGSKVIMKGGFYPEPMTISDALTLTAHDGSALVGGYYVGWRDVTLNLSSGESTNARVYYPSWATGENTQIASPCRGQPFPAVVYAHGLRTAESSLCGWSDDALRTDFTKDYLQAEGLLKRLASSGFIAISFNWHGLTIHYHDDGKNNIAQFAIDAITHLGNEFGGSVDLQNVGLIGHSTGGAAVIKAAEMLRGSRNPPAQIKGVGLIAPSYPFMQSNLNPIGPVLVINGTREHPCQVGLQPLEIYCEATPPKHLVYVTGANHFGYTDGICLDPDPPANRECVGVPFDPYGLNPRDFLLNAAPGWDNSSEVGGLTGQGAHALQQLAAANYLQAFFAHYLQGNAAALDYLIQQNSRKEQCGHPSLNQDCAVDFLVNTPVDPPSNLEFVPVRYFPDIQSLNVQVKVTSCTQ